MNGIRGHRSHPNIVPTRNAVALIGIRKGNVPKLGEIKRASEVGGHGRLRKYGKPVLFAGQRDGYFLKEANLYLLHVAIVEIRVGKLGTHYQEERLRIQMKAI